MNIYFSPEASGTVFLKPADGASVMMDTQVVNTLGLVQMLELRLGIHDTAASASERIAAYYRALEAWMKVNPGNKFERSYELSPLKVTQAVLGWRDQLRNARWDFRGTDVSERLRMIAEVEKFLPDDCRKDLTARIDYLIGQILRLAPDYSDLTVYVPCEEKYLHPNQQRLLLTIDAMGATVKVIPEAADDGSNLAKVRRLIATGSNEPVTLDTDDPSLRIVEFNDEFAANQYLAHAESEDVDVWINPDNKQMDDWLALMGKPVTGSMMKDCSPQLTQMFISGVGLFFNPLNVVTLVEWLNMPLHPIDRYFRKLLAAAIVTEGGYRNAKCRELIQEYIDGRFVYLDDEQRKLGAEEQAKLRGAGREKRQKQVMLFLPPLAPTDKIDTARLLAFLDGLRVWALQQSQVDKENPERQLVNEQLLAVSTKADELLILMAGYEEDEVRPRRLDQWLSAIFSTGSYTNAVAERGCRCVVDSPGKLLGIAGRAVWMGCEDDAPAEMECSFLHPYERKALAEGSHITLWEEEFQRRYINLMQLTPLYRTQKALTIVTCHYRGGEPAQESTLVLRLKQIIKNFRSFVSAPGFKVEELEEVEKVKNSFGATELHFDHSELLQWPGHLSPTKLENLVLYPFDYLMEQLLGITYDVEATMKDISPTKGDVAHGVMQRLLAPRDGAECTDAATVAARVDGEFDTVYREVLEAKGAQLQLSENRLEEKLLREQLRECCHTIVDVLTQNHLMVMGCEQFVESTMNLDLPVEHDDDGNPMQRDMLGYIDLILEDEAGVPVVFDFKWIRESSTKYYAKTVRENRSIQLALYRHMLSEALAKQVKKVAYFLMPQGVVCSTSEFAGARCITVTPENSDDIVEQLRNSILYRKSQLDAGIVELGGPIDQIAYAKDTDEGNLFRLEEKDGDKKENPFSNYNLFSK